LIPVAPFSVLFTAIVAAQAPECYSLSRIYLCGEPPRPPDLSMILVPTPTEEEFINHDVLQWRPKCHLPPRGMPPYTTAGRFSSQPKGDCTKPTLSDYKDGDELLRVQACLPGRRDICPIDELRPVHHGPAASDEAWTVFIP
jgi:hypothetical protein